MHRTASNETGRSFKKWTLQLIRKMLLLHQGKEKHQYHCYMMILVKN